VTLTLRSYQNTMIEYITTHDRCNIFAEMGLGKTVSVLTALDYLSITDDIFPVLILAPLRVARFVWKDEVEKWPHLRHLTVSCIVGTATERRVAIKAKAQIYVTNYDNLVWLIEELGDKWPFKTVVSDEITRLKSMRLRQGGKRSGALAKIAFSKIKRFYGLSGTPCSNGLKDLWSICWFIDQGQRLGRSFAAFQQRWFRPNWSGFSVEPLPHAQKEIEDKLKDICFSMKSADYFDLKEPIINKIYVELPPESRKIYKEMEKKFFTELEGRPIEAVNAAAKSMNLLEIANGAVYVGEGAKEWKEAHDVKIKALEEVIEESAGMPVLVAYHFRSDHTRLSNAFPTAKTLDKNEKTIKDWNDGKIPILLAHPASAGHGLNLANGSNIIAFFSIDWNLENHLQIIERIGAVRQLQAGFERNTFIHYIISKNTIDELVLERLTTKRKVQDILMEALKARRNL